MEKIAWILFLTLSTSMTYSNGSFKLDDDKIKQKGVVIIHYNAEFNSSNSYKEISKIKDAKIYKAWIDKTPQLKQEEGIRSVPTIILYQNGNEVKRWEGGLQLKLTVPLQEVQKEVDNLTGANKF
tara:strand:+ start:365 stop:739 length:375 start_codon:yes stop_codon:yes gene_type:complete